MNPNSSCARGQALGGEAAGRVLTAKNVHALRTLFNCAHRLAPLLGPAWLLVLGNLNRLDAILHSPRTTTQVLPCSAATGSPPLCAPASG